MDTGDSIDFGTDQYLELNPVLFFFHFSVIDINGNSGELDLRSRLTLESIDTIVELTVAMASVTQWLMNFPQRWRGHGHVTLFLNYGTLESVKTNQIWYKG